jgi:FtsZ-interacting cell division protein ZipA
MGWLHSVGEVEVPEGFLPELYKKMEERKRAPLGDKTRGRWFGFPLSFKLPVQAVAMVAIVFLVLYLTKMMPMEGYRMKEAKQPSFPLSEEKKSEQVLSQKEMEKERRVLETPAETPHPKDMDLAKAPVPKEERLEAADAPQVKAEAKKDEAPSSRTEIMAINVRPKEAARAKRHPRPARGQPEGWQKLKRIAARKFCRCF